MPKSLKFDSIVIAKFSKVLIKLFSSLIFLSRLSFIKLDLRALVVSGEYIAVK